MSEPDLKTPSEATVESDFGSFLTLLLMIAALIALGYSGLKLIDIVKLPAAAPTAACVNELIVSRRLTN